MPINDETLKQHISAVLKTEDLCGLSLRGVREKLAKEPFNISEDDINASKQKIKMLVTTLLPEAKEAQQKALTREQMGEPREPVAEPDARPEVRTPKGGKGAKRPAADTDGPPAKRGGGKKGAGKGVTDFSRQRFHDTAPTEVICKLDNFNTSVPTVKREFSTGSCGWYGNAKVVAIIDGEPVRVQCQFSMICVGSKEWTG